MLPPIRNARPPNIFFSTRPVSPATSSRIRPASSSSYATTRSLRSSQTAIEGAIRVPSSPLEQLPPEPVEALLARVQRRNRELRLELGIGQRLDSLGLPLQRPSGHCVEHLVSHVRGLLSADSTRVSE